MLALRPPQKKKRVPHEHEGLPLPRRGLFDGRVRCAHVVDAAGADSSLAGSAVPIVNAASAYSPHGVVVAGCPQKASNHS